MNAYTVPLSCPRCGGELYHQTSGVPGLLLTQAIAACAECVHEYIVRVVIEPVRAMPYVEPAPTLRPDSEPHPVIGMILQATGGHQ